MDDLFTIAKAGDKDIFVEACKERVACVAKNSLDKNGNPFHIAASEEFLLSALKEIIKYLEEDTKSKIEKAKEAKNWKEVKKIRKRI